MKNIIQFMISRDDEGYYSASGVGVPVVTQGGTLDELVKNIREAVELLFSESGPEERGYSAKPSVMFNIEMPLSTYA